MEIHKKENNKNKGKHLEMDLTTISNQFHLNNAFSHMIQLRIILHNL